MIQIQTNIKAPIETVWACFTKPEHIVNWNQASPDWHCPKAENNLIVGGRFTYTMAAKDGSFSFDFSGTYTEVIEYRSIRYTLDDGRKVHAAFETADGITRIIEHFEPEQTNPPEMQQAGWQAILNHFTAYTEKISGKSTSHL